MRGPTHPDRYARLARLTSPHTGWCGRCGMPWGDVQPYIIDFSPSSGCFPCCDRCWPEMGLQERLDHASRLVDKQAAQAMEAGYPREADRYRSKRVLIDAAIIKEWGT